MDDAISRKGTSAWLENMGYSYPAKVVMDEKRFPSVVPKRGKWILDRSGAYCCSECMEPCATYVMMKPRDKFCKMCGAKMEVTE